MPVTPTWSIFYRNTSTPASLETESATQAASVDAALTTFANSRAIRSFKWANAAAKNAQTGMTEGDIGDQADTNTVYRYSGSAWKPMDGVVPVVPTSVAGTGVTLGANGKVSFSSTSSITVNGVFNADFQNYKIIYDDLSSSSAIIQYRNTLLGNPATTGYDRQETYNTGGTVGGGGTSAQANFALNSGGNTLHLLELLVKNPAVVAATHIFCEGNSYTTGSSYNHFSGGAHSTATAYDGFNITLNTGNTTGSIRIYGYNDN